MPFGVDDAIAIAGVIGSIFGKKNKPSAQQQQGAAMQGQAGGDIMKAVAEMMRRGVVGPGVTGGLGDVQGLLRNRALGGGPLTPDPLSQGMIADQDAQLSAYQNRMGPGMVAANNSGLYQKGANLDTLSGDLAQSRIGGVRDILGQQYQRQGQAIGEYGNFLGGREQVANQQLGNAAGAAGQLFGAGGSLFQQGLQQSQLANAERQQLVQQLGTVFAPYLEKLLKKTAGGGRQVGGVPTGNYNSEGL